MKIIDYSKTKSIISSCGALKEGLKSNIGFARVTIKKITDCHYHKKTTEYYLVLSGRGVLRTKKLKGQIREAKLKPGILIEIETKELHQIHSIDSLQLETISVPAWNAKDEFFSPVSLFNVYNSGK